MIRALTYAAILVVAASCSGRRSPPGELSGVTPSAFESGFSGVLVIDGRGFASKLKVDFDHPPGSELSPEYRAWLVKDGVEQALSGVTRTSDERLEATVARGTAPGTWSLRVVDPFDRTLLLESAVEVTAECTDDAGCGETRTCRAAGRCVGFVCEYENAAAGTACDDGDLCTTGAETCDGRGRCVASGQVRCDAAPGCYEGPGVCDPASGLCSYTPSSAGSACSDGDACTVANEACDGAGACVSGAPVACTTPGACGVAGTGSCDSGTGACEYQPVSCDSPPNAQCFEPAGTCSEADGCQYVVRVDSGCDDANACTLNDTCTAGGSCSGKWDATIPGCGANLPPTACVTVSPRGVVIGQPVTIDTSCSTDMEESSASLRVRIDVDGDGVWEHNPTFQSGQPKSWTGSYSSPGLKRIQVQVQDTLGFPGQLVHWAETFVAVAPAADALFEVTTADLDDDDRSSGGFDIRTNPIDGRSLREVIDHLNANPVTGAVVTFSAGLNALAGGPLPGVDAAEVVFIGHPGVALDFEGQTTETGCVDLRALGVRWIGIDVGNCGGHPLQMKSDGVLVAESRFTPSGPSSPAVKIQSIAGGTFGPRNLLEGWTDGTAFDLKAPNVRIVGNRFRNNRTAIEFNPYPDTVVEGNTFVGHSGTAVRVAKSANGTTIRFNTFVNTGGNALELQTATNQSAQNNLFVNTGGYAIFAPSSTAVNAEPNGFFESGGGHLSWGTPGAASGVGDPLFVDLTNGDFYLRPGSPMIDAGVPLTGVDVNGSKAGDHDGAAPDFGAYESPF